MSRQILIVLMVLSQAAVAENWTETFDNGVGRLGETRGNGASNFAYDPQTQSISATFVRYQHSTPIQDQRFAFLEGGLANFENRFATFSMAVTPLSASSGSNNSIKIGLFNSNASLAAQVDFDRNNGAVRPQLNGSTFDPNPGIPFVYGQVYFVVAHLNGPSRTFAIDVYEGADVSGNFLGHVVRSLNPEEPLFFDAFGMFNTGTGSEQSTFTAIVDDLSLTTRTDCNENGVDEPAQDCNANDIPDECDLHYNSRLVATVTPSGGVHPPSAWGPVLVYDLRTDPMSSLSSIPAESVSDPTSAAVTPWNEVLVGNRHGGSGGSVSRFLFSDSGDFIPNGTIEGNGLDRVHQIAVTDDGDLFCANYSGSISRFLVNSSGGAEPRGVVAAPPFGLVGLAIAPWREVFATNSGSSIQRFGFDSVTDELTPAGTFAVPGASGLHFLTFDSDGSLWAADLAGSVFRCVFDANLVPTCETKVLVDNAISVAFGSGGKVFVAGHGAGGITSFIRSESGQLTFVNFVPTPSLSGMAVLLAASDCNSNEIPDECEISENDCNQNDIIDSCEIAGGGATDCNANSIPDECDLTSVTSADCNANAVPDECELIDQDCNVSGILDECELEGNDCNLNGILDSCDISQGAAEDCQANGVPDSCDIAAQVSRDCNADGVPDECTPLAAPVSVADFDKCRTITIVPGNPGRTIGVRVKLASLHHVVPPYTGGPSAPFSGFEGQFRWVGEPRPFIESTSIPIVFQAASLQCNPYYRDWDSINVLHVYGSEIVPSSLYEVQVVSADCSPLDEANFTTTAFFRTTRWGDVESLFNPPSQSTQPDLADVAALVNKFRSAPDAPAKARAMLVGTMLDFGVDLGFDHIAACVDAFRGRPYPHDITACP